MKTYIGLVFSFLLVWTWATTASASWGQFRKDAQRSAQSGTPLDIDIPGIRWSLPVGGSAVGVFTLDLDGDQKPDLLSLEGGKVVARNMEGIVFWDSPPIMARQIVDVRDLNGDGASEVIVDVVTGVVVLALDSGALLWQSSATLVIENICTCLVEDVIGESYPEVLVADCAMNGGKPYLKGTVHLFSFEEGFESDLPLVSTEEDSRDYESGGCIGLADMDGDGAKEIIAAGWHHFYAYDVITGGLKYSSEDLTSTMGEENFARCRYEMVDVDGDGSEEVFVFTDWVFIETPSRRLFLLEYDEESSWKVGWTDSVPDPQLDAHAWPEHPVADVNKDGVLDVVSSRWNSENGWTTHIYDAQTGLITDTLAGERVLDVVDPYQTGQALLLSVTSELREPGAYAMKKLIELGEDEPQEIFALAARLWVGPFHGVFSPDSPGELVALWDSDADDWADQVGVFSLPDGELVASTPTTDLATQAMKEPLSGEGGIIVFNASGEVAVYDRWLSLRNDSDLDGHGDLRYGGYTINRVAVSQEEEGSSLVAMPAAGGRLKVVDGGTGNPFTDPELVLEVGGNLEQRPVFLSLNEQKAVVVFALDLERQLTARAVLMDGSTAWSAVLGGAGGVFALMWDPLVSDVNGDGVDDLALLVRDDSVSGVHRLLAVNGLSGQLLWPAVELPTAGGGVGFLSASPEGTTLYVVANKTIYAVDGTSGDVVTSIQSPANHWYGLVQFAQLDDEDGLEMIVTGTSKGISALSSEFDVLWTHEPGPSSRAPATFVDNGAELTLYAARAASPVVDVLRATDGTVLQTFALIYSSFWENPENLPDDAGNVVDIVAVTDLVGNGKPGVLITSTDGYLYAVDVEGQLRWTMTLGGTLGAPAIYDADEDGTGEILVPVATGHLAVVEKSVLEATEYVCENDGTGPAFGMLDDLDEQESGSNLHVNWAEVEGATGYTVQLYSAFGTLVREIPNVSDGLSCEFTDLALQLGQSYYVWVRSLKVDDGHAVTGGLNISDGVTIVDLAPPEILSFGANPEVFSAGNEPSQTVFTAEMFDSRELAQARLEIHSEEDQLVGLWESNLSGTSETRTWDWDGSDGSGSWVASGNYVASLWVQDAAGKTAQAFAEVTVCAPPLLYDVTKDACVRTLEPEVVDEAPGEDVVSEDVLAAPDGVDSLGEEDISTEPVDDGGGCACDQTATKDPWKGALWWWLMCGVLVLIRRRWIVAVERG